MYWIARRAAAYGLNLQNFLSDTFFHLVGRRAPNDDAGNSNVLPTILKSGCLRNTSAGTGLLPTSTSLDLTKSLASGNLLVPTMTCYCDIPYSGLGFHAGKYGRFGIGFPRDFVIDRGARPVMYFPMQSDDWRGMRGATVLKDIEAAYRGFHSRFVEPAANRSTGSRTRKVGHLPSTDDEAIEDLNRIVTREFFGYLKPYNSSLPEHHVDYYYSEREWRSTIFLRFVPADVSIVVVAKGYADLIKRAAPAYSSKVREL